MDLYVNKKLLRELRESKMLTQEELAEAAKVHPRTIQRMEGEGVASSRTIAAVAAVLGVQSEELRAASMKGKMLRLWDYLRQEEDDEDDGHAPGVAALVLALCVLIGAGLGYVHSILTAAPMEEAIWGGLLGGACIGMFLSSIIASFFEPKNPNKT